MPKDGAIRDHSPPVHPLVLADIETWADDPALGKLYSRLNAHAGSRRFLDTLAEALVARHLRSRGCVVEFEVPTPGYPVVTPNDNYSTHRAIHHCLYPR